jgi:hypothetical protein
MRKTLAFASVAIAVNEISKSQPEVIGSIFFMVMSDLYYSQYILYFAENSPYSRLIIDLGVLFKNILGIILLDLLRVVP